MNAIDIVKNETRLFVTNPRLPLLIEWLDNSMRLRNLTPSNVSVLCSTNKDCFRFSNGETCPDGTIVGVRLYDSIVMMDDIAYDLWGAVVQ